MGPFIKLRTTAGNKYLQLITPNFSRQLEGSLTTGGESRVDNSDTSYNMEELINLPLFNEDQQEGALKFYK